MDVSGGAMFKAMRTGAAALALAIGLCACATAPAPRVQVDTLFDDSRFAASLAPPMPDVFAVSPAMRARLDSTALREQLRRQGAARGLVAALYDGGGLKLEYDSERTRTAAEAFEARRGNCLSLVLMTAAFARELGLPVRFQQVVVDESWRRSGALVVGSGHVNLSLGRPAAIDGERFMTIDFLPASMVAGYRSFEIEEATVVAMYRNNRAVESMLTGELDAAYWWTRAALLGDPAYIGAYNTLAVIYQRHGDAALAERSWRLGLAREPENVMLMQNLAPLLAAQGRQAEADDLLRRAAAIEPYPPFHFYRLGMTAMDQHDYATAKKWFAREVKRAPYYDEFHFWLGAALLQLGEVGAARSELALAAETSTSAATRGQYIAKLEQLRRRAPALE